MMYAIKEAKEYNADCIISLGNKTYIGRLNPSIVDYESQTPIEEQHCWNICLIEETTDEATGMVTTTSKYPDGHSSLYNYAIAFCDQYTYEYQK